VITPIQGFDPTNLNKQQAMPGYKFQPPKEDSSIVPFGKYKGQRTEIMLADQNYMEWLTSQPGLMRMLETRYQAIFNIIMVGAPKTDDTPDHNRLQALSEPRIPVRVH